MGYNITAFKIKKMENFTIPWKLFFELTPSEYELKPVSFNQETKEVVITAIGDQEIKGKIIEGAIVVSHIDIREDFSGYFFNEAFLPILEHTKGKLVATIVWEGGDTIEKLKVNDGNVVYYQKD